MNGRYKLVQTMEDGSTKRIYFYLPTQEGTYKLTANFNNGTSKELGTVTVGDNIKKYALLLNINGEGDLSSNFSTFTKLSAPTITEKYWDYERYMGYYFGSIVITNPNTVAMDCLLRYNLNYFTDPYTRTFKLQAGESKKIWFSDIYSTGIYVRVDLMSEELGIGKNVCTMSCSLGTFTGSSSMGDEGEEEEESSTTTTTTTTPATTSAEYKVVDTDGNFTLWRKQDVE